MLASLLWPRFGKWSRSHAPEFFLDEARLEVPSLKVLLADHQIGHALCLIRIQWPMDWHFREDLPQEM